MLSSGNRDEWYSDHCQCRCVGTGVCNSFNYEQQIMNKKNLARVMNQIIEHPETWDQSNWHCGTSHCFAGWAQVMSGKNPSDLSASDDAREWLGLGYYDSKWLFAASTATASTAMAGTPAEIHSHSLKFLLKRCK